MIDNPKKSILFAFSCVCHRQVPTICSNRINKFLLPQLQPLVKANTFRPNGLVPSFSISSFHSPRKMENFVKTPIGNLSSAELNGKLFFVCFPDWSPPSRRWWVGFEWVISLFWANSTTALSHQPPWEPTKSGNGSNHCVCAVMS